MVSHLREKLGDIEELIELEDSMHGIIRFFRKVVIPGIERGDKKRLTEILNQSGLINERALKHERTLEFNDKP